jgi:hypothetical protein
MIRYVKDEVMFEMEKLFVGSNEVERLLAKQQILSKRCFPGGAIFRGIVSTNCTLRLPWGSAPQGDPDGIQKSSPV